MPESVLLSAIKQALKNLRYGMIQITVHEGKLVKIERVEKIRIPTPLAEDLTGDSGGQ